MKYTIVQTQYLEDLKQRAGIREKKQREDEKEVLHVVTKQERNFNDILTLAPKAPRGIKIGINGF